MKRFWGGQVYHFYDRLGVIRCDVNIVDRFNDTCVIRVISQSEGYDDGFYTVKITTIDDKTECIPLSDKPLYVLHITPSEKLNKQCYATNKLLSFICTWCGVFYTPTAVIVNQLSSQDLRKSYFNRWFSRIDSELKKGAHTTLEKALTSARWLLTEGFIEIDKAINNTSNAVCHHDTGTIMVYILQDVTITEFTFLGCSDICIKVENRIAHYLEYVASDYSHPIPIKSFS